jgi:hypothetical protein
MFPYMHILLFMAGLHRLTTSFLHNCQELACFLKSGVTDYVGTLQINSKIATNSKNKNIRDLYRGIKEFKTGYQLRNNIVKDENGNLLEDSHNVLNRWKNYSSQLLNVHNVSDVRQIEVHTAEELVPGPSRLEVVIAIAKLKKYKSPGSGQIPAELIQEEGEILLSAIHKLINSVNFALE